MGQFPEICLHTVYTLCRGRSIKNAAKHNSDIQSERAMFERNLSHDGHTRRFLITVSGAQGWEVREEQDSAVIRAKVYDDWHRVERARSAFQAEISTLTDQGWVVDPAYSTNR